VVYGTPRWEGDCGYCAALEIPPGMTVQCGRCGLVVCFGHTKFHQKECDPPEAFADRPFGWEPEQREA
jgi:hypothetical protein